MYSHSSLNPLPLLHQYFIEPLCLYSTPSSSFHPAGRDEEARKVIRELRGEHINVNEEIQNYRAMNEGREGRSVWRGLLQPRVLKSLAIVSMLFVIVFFSGKKLSL